MDAIPEAFSRAIEELLGRSSGPLHLRLIVQPIVATFLAIRAGAGDAKQDRPPFLWTIFTSAEARRELVASGWKDISGMFVIAMVLDTLYQVMMLSAFHVVQTLVVAVTVAVVPYSLMRGFAGRTARLIAGRRHRHVAEV